MNFREIQPNHRHTTEPDTFHRIAESMIKSSGSINVIPENFPQPARFVLKTMKALHLGGIALLIPSEKPSLKDPVDTKP